MDKSMPVLERVPFGGMKRMILSPLSHVCISPRKMDFTSAKLSPFDLFSVLTQMVRADFSAPVAGGINHEMVVSKGINITQNRRIKILNFTDELTAIVIA